MPLARKAKENLMTAVLDAGIGGLLILRALIKKFPKEPFIYLADQKHFPYGDKNSTYIRNLLKENVCFLNHQGAKRVIVACNTASAVLEKTAGAYPIPVTGVILASLKQAQKESQNGKVGLLATTGTVRSQAFLQIATESEARTRSPRPIKIYQQACPLLAPFVEKEGWKLWLDHHKTLSQKISTKSRSERKVAEALSPPRQAGRQAGRQGLPHGVCPTEFAPRGLPHGVCPTGSVPRSLPHARRLLDRYIPPLLDRGVDTIILGCTHYLYLRPFIEQYLGESQKVVGPEDFIIKEFVPTLGPAVSVKLLVSGSNTKSYKNKCQQILEHI